MLLRSRPLRLRVAARDERGADFLRGIAPALIPRRAGDRIKTDRRDAGQLAVLFRAGALTVRCREDIRADLLRARQDVAVARPHADT